MSEILKGVWARLYAWAFPSALALGAFWVFVYAKTTLTPAWLTNATDGEMLALFMAASGAMAITLSALSTALYRILEGYLLWPAWLQEAGRQRQLRRKQAFTDALAGTGGGWKKGLALERLARFPQRDDQVVPTRFGNAIRSFETYGKTRFNLDSQTLWHELCAVAPKYIGSEMDSARASVDFFVALFYLGLVFGVATLSAAVYEGLDRALVVSGLASLVVVKLSHGMAIRAIDEWSYTVQALVNLGRAPLATALGLHLPDTLSDEKVMWGLVTRFVYHADAAAGTALDRFRRTPAVPVAAGPGAAGSAAQEEDEDA
ncbi:MAG: hypothetical protein ABWY78_08080 [Microvirga sp.]